MFRVALFLVFLLLPLGILAQVFPPDTAFVKSSVKNAVQLYRSEIEMQVPVYTGAEYYVAYKSYVQGHQFFKNKSFEESAVQYSGVWFYDVPLLYDIVLDEVITINPGEGHSQKLVKEKVDAFQLGGHTFIHIRQDSATGTVLKPGFYDLCYDGDVKYVVRRVKTLQERAGASSMEGNYDEVNSYFIWKNGKYHAVSSKGAVLKVLHDQKKQLKAFIKDNNLRFKTERENTILKVVQHYDTLTQ